MVKMYRLVRNNDNKSSKSKMMDLQQKNILLRRKVIFAQQQLKEKDSTIKLLKDENYAYATYKQLTEKDATIKFLKQENVGLHEQILKDEDYAEATYNQLTEKDATIKVLKQENVLLQQKVICAQQCDLYSKSIHQKLKEHEKTILVLRSRENSLQKWENNLHAWALDIAYEAAKNIETFTNIEQREKELKESVYTKSIHLKLAEQEKTISQLQNNLLMLPLKQNELQEWEDELCLKQNELQEWEDELRLKTAYNTDKQ